MLVACNPRGPGPNAVATPEGWGTPVFDSPTPSRTPGPYVSPTPTPTPTVDPCAAEIYEHEPREPFDLVGIVEVQRQNPGDRDSTLLESARDAACRLGGDAIVILYRSKRRHGGIPERPQAGVLPDVDLRGVVIRFRR